MSEPIREQLAKEIGKHYYLTRSAGNEASCMCRQWVESVQRKPYTTWAQHVADALVVELAFLSPVGETEASVPERDATPDEAFELGRIAGYDEAMREVAGETEAAKLPLDPAPYVTRDEVRYSGPGANREFRPRSYSTIEGDYR